MKIFEITTSWKWRNLKIGLVWFEGFVRAASWWLRGLESWSLSQWKYMYIFCRCVTSYYWNRPQSAEIMTCQKLQIWFFFSIEDHLAWSFQSNSLINFCYYKLFCIFKLIMGNIWKSSPMHCAKLMLARWPEAISIWLRHLVFESRWPDWPPQNTKI